MQSGYPKKKYLNTRLYIPKFRKLSNTTSNTDIFQNLTTDLENQKTQYKMKKLKNLIIQTNFDEETGIKNKAPKTSVFANTRVDKTLFYPKSCKNVRYSPHAKKKGFFEDFMIYPRTAKNSPGLDIEKQARMAFSSKDTKNDRSIHFFVSNKRDVDFINEKPIKTTFDKRGLYKKSFNKPYLSFKPKNSQKENNSLKYNTTFNKIKVDSSISYGSKTKTLSIKRKPINYFNTPALSIKSLCYFMDCTENLMNYSLTLNIGISENTYFENYTELVNIKSISSADEIFNTDKGQNVMTYLKYEYLFTVFIYNLGQQLIDNVEEINETLQICVKSRFIILNLLKTEPDIKTPSKTLIEEFTDSSGYASCFNDREAAICIFTQNTSELIKSIEYMALLMSNEASSLIRSIVTNIAQVDIKDVIMVCTELFTDKTNKQINGNIYENLKPKRQNFIIQPYRTNSLLPPNSSKHEYTLVLDLDETLIHCKRQETKGRILLRPYVKEFLSTMAKYFEIVVFTAADKQYADWVLDRLDTDRVISHRLYRCSTSNQNGFIFKDLCKLGRDLAKLLIVDNKPDNFAFQPENGIEILSWYDDPTDNALVELMGLLCTIGKQSNLDLRVALKSHIHSIE